LFPNAVVGQEFVQFIQTNDKGFTELLDVFEQSSGKVLGHSSGADECGMHAGTGDTFVVFHQLFPSFESPEVRGHGPYVKGMATYRQEMVQQAGDLQEQHSDVFGPKGNPKLEEFLNGSGVRVFLGHHRYVVQAIEVGKSLHVGFVFQKFLGPSVSQSNMGIGTVDDFSVEFEDQSEYSVGGRVLRTEVDTEVLSFFDQMVLFSGNHGNK
jgi:hypothetical protein